MHFMSYFRNRHSAIKLTPYLKYIIRRVFCQADRKGLENSNLGWVGTKTIENEALSIKTTERYKDGK